MKKPLSFKDATRKMKQLEGVDLHELASEHGVTVVNSDTGLINKGWAGVTLERVLGIEPSNHGPDGGSWELKTVPVYEDEDGEISIKETAAITMINESQLRAETFENSMLYSKICRMVVVFRRVDRESGRQSILKVVAFDLHNYPEILARYKKDYDTIRGVVRQQGKKALNGFIGVDIQPRTKGPGNVEKADRTHAFYLRKEALRDILNLIDQDFQQVG